MISHVAFLRAINTGGRRITNVDLVEAVRAVGFEEVQAYQASGNLLIGASGHLVGDEVARRLSEGLGEQLGYDVPAVVRTTAELVALVSARPFGDADPPSGSRPQVILLAAPKVDPGLFDGHATPDDRLAMVGRDIHWWPREGISTSELDLTGLERSVGTMTVRTLGTVQRIVAKAT